MNESLYRCRSCGRMKDDDGMPKCGGMYCLRDDRTFGEDEDERGAGILEASQDRSDEPRP